MIFPESFSQGRKTFLFLESCFNTVRVRPSDRTQEERFLLPSSVYVLIPQIKARSVDFISHKSRRGGKREEKRNGRTDGVKNTAGSQHERSLPPPPFFPSLSWC